MLHLFKQNNQNKWDKVSSQGLEQKKIRANRRNIGNRCIRN